MTLGNKVANGESIASNVSRSEALVGHIEEGEEFLLLGNIGEGGPLLGGGVDTGGVVGTRVEEDDRVFRCRLLRTCKTKTITPQKLPLTKRSAFMPSKSRLTFALSK